jgi:hypothetical protein
MVIVCLYVHWMQLTSIGWVPGWNTGGTYGLGTSLGCTRYLAWYELERNYKCTTYQDYIYIDLNYHV